MKPNWIAAGAAKKGHLTVSSDGKGWKTAFVLTLVNSDFIAWLRGEGVWEIRTNEYLRVPLPRWEKIASSRTREDGEATMAEIVAQHRRREKR